MVSKNESNLPEALEKHGFEFADDLISRYHSQLYDAVPFEEVLFSVWVHVIIINASDIADGAYGKESGYEILMSEVIERFKARFEDELLVNLYSKIDEGDISTFQTIVRCEKTYVRLVKKLSLLLRNWK